MLGRRVCRSVQPQSLVDLFNYNTSGSNALGNETRFRKLWITEKKFCHFSLIHYIDILQSIQ